VSETYPLPTPCLEHWENNWDFKNEISAE
jgi:hypothetical protein